MIGAAVHSVRAVEPESIAAIASWSRGHHVPLHAHVSEQPAENDECIAAYGCSPTELLDQNGAIDERFTAVHATHLSERDVELLGQNRATGCICVTTERDLADGIGPTVALRDAGAALCIGSDSHAVVDPFEETRGIELDERLRSGRRGNHRPLALLAAASSAGYRSLGWDGGRIAPGAVADLVVVSTDSARLAGGGDDDLAGSLVFGATASDVCDVIVGGEHVVVAGRHRDLDVAAQLHRSIGALWEAC